MRAVLLVMLVGCAVDPIDDPDAHEIVSCASGWITNKGEPAALCEAACQEPPTAAIGASDCKIGSTPGGVTALFCPGADVVAGGCCQFAIRPGDPERVGGSVNLYPCL